MKKEDVQDSFRDALLACLIPSDSRTSLLSDNGSCYIAKEFKTYLHKHGMDQVRGAPNHPQTQGKIERYHRSMKIVLMQDIYFKPEQLEVEIKKWVDYYNNERYHESLNNLTPSDIYHGRGEQKLKERAEIKRKTMEERRRIYQQQKAAS